MNVQLKPFDFASAVARAGIQAPAAPSAPASGPAATAGVQGTAGSFRAAMGQALQNASALQLEASRAARELQLDNPTMSAEQTMTAIVKAQVGFQSVLQVRNRLLSAYSEIMNMQV